MKRTYSRNTKTDKKLDSEFLPAVIKNYLRINLLLIVALTCIHFGSVQAQGTGPRQTIRGRVIDKDSKMFIPGANISLLNALTSQATTSDNDGNFRLTNIPVGRQGIQVSMVGYKPAVIPNLIINSAQETVLEIELEENVVLINEVVVKAPVNKQSANNLMAVVSARNFTVEETEKFAGCRGDVARMAMNYAGVMAANDSRNDIVIRGNSPGGLLWRLEDVDIPNPNHFAENGTTGGPVGMINNNMLMNSDFFTSAFPAEYGNATSGVFDLKMRNGNNERHEFLFQSGFNGFEAGAEGPFSKNYKGSYLINARYSTLEAVDGLVDFGTSGVPKYKDISYKINLPLKHGRITIFGLGGLSRIDMLDSKNKGKNMYTDEGQDLYNRSKTGATGIALTRFINDKTYYKLSVSAIYASGGTVIDTLDNQSSPHLSIDHNYADFRITASGFIHKKYSSRLSTKSGFSLDRLGYDLYSRVYKSEDGGMRTVINDGKSLLRGPNLIRVYTEASYKFTDNIGIAPGIHLLYFDLTKDYALEPRVSAWWQPVAGQKLSIGYGLHSQIQSMATYFLGAHLPNGSLAETNKKLGPTRSHQFVIGYDIRLSETMRFKAETYYQHLFDVPVQSYPSAFSMLNTGAGWGFGAQDSMVNKGTGRNYGLEFTLERFFNKNYYFLTTLSLFQSKYKGSDGIERNTAFNGNYVFNLLLGREFPLNERSAFTLDIKSTLAGGKRYSPIDTIRSRYADETKYIDSQTNDKQFSAFFKTDVKIGYRYNGKHVSQEWQFYVENITDHQNVLMQSYNHKNNSIKTTYQLGFFPMVLYRIRF